MQEIHNLRKGFLRLVLPGNIVKGLARLRLHIDLGVALAKGHGVGAAHLFLHIAGEQLPQNKKHQNGEYPGENKRKKRRLFFRDFLSILNIRFIQAAAQRIAVLHFAGDEYGFFSIFVLPDKSNFILLVFHLGDLTRL